jgi:hypothetical protein
MKVGLDFAEIPQADFQVIHDVSEEIVWYVLFERLSALA